jgi:hypothetical protein
LFILCCTTTTNKLILIKNTLFNYPPCI